MLVCLAQRAGKRLAELRNAVPLRRPVVGNSARCRYVLENEAHARDAKSTAASIGAPASLYDLGRCRVFLRRESRILRLSYDSGSASGINNQDGHVNSAYAPRSHECGSFGSCRRNIAVTIRSVAGPRPPHCPPREQIGEIPVPLSLVRPSRKPVNTGVVMVWEPDSQYRRRRPA